MPTKIAWTQETWNCVRGCSKVSAGCQNCYAEKMANRLSYPGGPYEGLAKNGKWTGRARFVPEKIDAPLHWRKPRLVFVNSMGDLFHEDIRDEEIAKVLAIAMLTPRHTYQVLTKRPERMRHLFAASPPDDLEEYVTYLAAEMIRSGIQPPAWWEYCQQEHYHASTGVYLGRESWWEPCGEVWPLPNVWLGVTAENQEMADERIPILLETPAAVRFVSIEPLLSGVDCTDRFGRYREIGCDVFPCPDWIIVGDESGPRRRPAQLDWVRSIRDQCVAAGVPFFWKQSHETGKKVECPELDGKQWMEYPR